MTLTGGIELEEVTYKCNNCGKTVKSNNGKVPTCCDRPMEKLPLDICTQPSHAEHSRPMDDEDVCDDGRAG
jgi:hypothetical protein